MEAVNQNQPLGNGNAVMINNGQGNRGRNRNRNRRRIRERNRDRARIMRNSFAGPPYPLVQINCLYKFHMSIPFLYHKKRLHDLACQFLKVATLIFLFWAIHFSVENGWWAIKNGILAVKHIVWGCYAFFTIIYGLCIDSSGSYQFYDSRAVESFASGAWYPYGVSPGSFFFDG